VSLCARASSAILLAALFARDARAEGVTAGPPPTVVVLRAPSADPVAGEATARVEGELGAAGFHVVVMAVGAEAARRDIETVGRDLGALAAFAIFAEAEDNASVAEIWISDRVRQVTVVERARLFEADHQREAAVLAVRAVELLRASLAERWLRPGTVPPSAGSPAPVPPSTAVAPPGPAVAAPPAREPRDKPEREPDHEPPRGRAVTATATAAGLGFGVGGAMIDGFGAVGPVWLPMVRLDYRWESGVSVGLAFYGLGPDVGLAAANGSAKVEEQVMRLDGAKAWRPASWVMPFLCASLGAQHVHADGAASGAYAGVAVESWSLWTSAGGGLTFPLHASLSFVAQAEGAAAWPPTAVRIAGADAGHFGGPSLLLDAHLLGVFP
jgi:hypothetical protein